MNLEFKSQIQMTYEEQRIFLQNKYGLPPRDYYVNETCRSKPKENSRTKEGLEIHHNAEILDNPGNLGEKHIAKSCSFEYQKRNNLSYCNLLEHLLLHLKINARGSLCEDGSFELDRFFTSEGFFMLALQINDLYHNSGGRIEWQNNLYNAIKDHFEDYCSLLRGVRCYIDEKTIDLNKTEMKNANISKGSQIKLKVLFDKTAMTICFDIEEIHDEEDIIILRLNDDRITSLPPKKHLSPEEIIDYADNFRDLMVFLQISSEIYRSQLDEFMIDFDYIRMSKDNFVKPFIRWMKKQEIVWLLSDIKARLDNDSHRRNWLDDITRLHSGKTWDVLKEELNKPYNSEDIWIKEIIKEKLV